MLRYNNASGYQIPFVYGLFITTAQAILVEVSGSAYSNSPNDSVFYSICSATFTSSTGWANGTNLGVDHRVQFPTSGLHRKIAFTEVVNLPGGFLSSGANLLFVCARSANGTPIISEATDPWTITVVEQY